MMTELEEGFTASGLPNYMLEGTRRYMRDHRPVGGVLMALFANDLRETVVRADEENSAALQQWLQFLNFYCPARSHGSPAAVDAWLKKGHNDATR